MISRHGISRRHMMAISAAGGLALGSGIGRASAQRAKRIEKLAPELDAILATDQPIVEIGRGFGGPAGPTEGPLWWKEGGYLLFSDINASKRMKYTPGQGITVFQEKTNGANGLTRDLQGRLLACEHDSRRVTRQELDGSLTVIANSFQGRRLNRPNDVIVKSDGSIYFTDPWSPALVREQWDLTFNGVYRLTPDLGTLTLLLDDMVFPNGLAFSPDESVLYVVDFLRGHIRAFDVAANGTIARATDRVFADLRGPDPGVPDGIKVDTAGNVYSGGSGGIYILDPKGKKLGRIVHGEAATTNIGFGGDDWKTLFFTTAQHRRLGEPEGARHSGAGAEEGVVEAARGGSRSPDERSDIREAPGVGLRPLPGYMAAIDQSGITSSQAGDPQTDAHDAQSRRRRQDTGRTDHDLATGDFAPAHDGDVGGRRIGARQRHRPRRRAGSKRIEKLAPELDAILATDQPIVEIGRGFGGPLGPAEGPLWWKEGGYLLFSDINASKRMKYTPGQGVTVFQEKTNRANGLTRDLQGRLLACEHETRRVTRQELDGSLTVIANSFQGRRLNRPNDVVVKSDGAIYFTDPWTNPLPREQWDLTFSGVYRLTPDLGTLTLLLDDMLIPNGIAFSPDESVLYVNDFAAPPHPGVRSRRQRHARAGRPTACSPTSAGRSPACPTA